MKFTVTKPTEIDVAFLLMTLPVDYGEEDMVIDFPFRDGDIWQVVIDIESGRIIDWPHGREGAIEMMKVRDGGVYDLLDANKAPIATINHEYVPHGLVPGEYGDYVSLNILGDGTISNWPKSPSIDDFFSEGSR